jgi:predicted aldo/keto reductase-like oxidoreductase
LQYNSFDDIKINFVSDLFFFIVNTIQGGTGIMKRRDFLKASVIATAAVAGSPLSSDASESKKDKAKVKTYNELGKTGLKISDISYGTGRLPSSSMILRAVDRGINYFDTAPDYGPSEKYIGQALKKIQRDKIIIASKFCTPYSYPSHLPLGSKKNDYIKAVEGSLSRLKTDYLDIGFVHAIGEQSENKEKEMKRLLAEEMLSAFTELKQAGKVRFLGVSSHGPNNMEELLMAAIKSGHYDMVMPSFNFMKFPKLAGVLKEASNRKVGVIAMKTLAGAKDSDFDSKGAPFAPAAFKWVLNHPGVNGLVITIKTVSDLDLYLTASGEKFTSQDQRTLDRYAHQFGKEYCRTGCNECEPSCPEGVAIATTLRYQMYFHDYGMEKMAMKSYAKLEPKAEQCTSCITQKCTGSCPYGLPVSALLRNAHDSLSFKV